MGWGRVAPMTQLEIVAVAKQDKPVLRQLLELYAYDFSQYDDADVNAHGLYDYAYLDNYWTEEGRYPFFIKVDGKLAGFVLVSGYTYALEIGTAKSISEFFVMRKYRRLGVGKRAALMIFDRFPGRWEVDQHGDNEPSKVFWEAIIAEYSDNQFEKRPIQTETWAGQALIFDNSNRF